MPPSRRLLAQFAEGGNAARLLSLDDAVARLRRVFALLPVTDLVIGWRLPSALLSALIDYVRSETAARLWLWHPLLVGDGSEPLDNDDLTIGPQGEPIVDPSGADEFTFTCPNRPAAIERSLVRLEGDLERFSKDGVLDLDGVLLDRVRWPSPSEAPDQFLACFCEACRFLAEHDGLSLQRVADDLVGLSATLEGRRQVIRACAGQDPDGRLGEFIWWRANAIARAVATATDRVQSRSRNVPMRVAVDVFSPSLALMMGQELRALARADWVKAMIYTKLVAVPAGMPFELARLGRWLMEAGESEPGEYLGGTFGYDVPGLEELSSEGLSSSVVSIETQRLREAVSSRAVAGIEVLEDPAIVRMSDASLSECLTSAGAMGVPIALSWDLARVQDERLAVISQCLEEAEGQGSTA